LENLSLEEINSLIANAGSSVVAKTSEFRQINASNEGQYRITYDANGVEITNAIFITQKEDGSFRVSVNSLS
jgi:thiamine biosynthesis lipoprotein ApbE